MTKPTPVPTARYARRPNRTGKPQRNAAILATAQQGMTFTAVGERYSVTGEQPR